MVSSGVRQALKLAAALLALAAYTSALHAADESGTDSSADRQQQLLATIQETLSRDGPYAPDLLGPLTALIELYREEEDDALAAVTIERARQVVRVNNGLHTLEQVPYMEQLIRIEKARGNHGTAWDLRQELLALVRRYPQDLRTVPVLREDAERHMNLLAQYLGGERPPELYLGCYYKPALYRGGGDDGGGCDSGEREKAVRSMVAEAQRSYLEAIAVLSRNELYDSEELRELEVEVLRGLDLVRTQFGRDLGSYYPGRQSLDRLYGYEAAASRPILSQARAAAQIADWELLYSNNGDAVGRYALVVTTLQEAGVAQASIDELFLPDLPVVLPSFQPNPLARDEGKDATGHIDVAFEITKYGKGKSIEILDTTTSTTDAARLRLVELIQRSRFRPRMSHGALDDPSRVVVRYYVND